MNKLMIGFVGAAALMSFGCKKKSGGGDAVAKMEEFQKKMCDCKDKACADKVNEEMTKWGTEMAKNAGKEAKPDPEIAKKSADIMTKYTECMTKNMMAGAGSGSGDNKMAGSGSGDTKMAGSGSGDAGSGAGSGSGDNHRPGSAGDIGTTDKPKVDDTGIKFGEKLPEHWVATGHQLDHVEEPPKDVKWTAEFAHYVFDYGLDDPTMPKDHKEYIAVLEKALHEKLTKDEKLKNGHYYETEHSFRYVIDAGDKRIHCGGSLYKDPEHDKIAKIRDNIVATAKKICASAKL